ncbi:hypothetical protein YIM730264_20400 [Thermus hydrothermalis]
MTVAVGNAHEKSRRSQGRGYPVHAICGDEGGTTPPDRHETAPAVGDGVKPGGYRPPYLSRTRQGGIPHASTALGLYRKG